MYTIENQINTFKRLNYHFNFKNIKKEVFKLIRNSYSSEWDEDLDKSFSGLNKSKIVSEIPYKTLYCYMGRWVQNTEFRLCDNCLWWELDAFDGEAYIGFTYFMERMGVISRGELKFESITCYDNNGDGDKFMEFTVNGIRKKWNLGMDIPDSYITRFALLCQELKTKGNYTIYDDGGIQFVLDYATKEELQLFRDTTNLDRVFLLEGNRFSMPDN
jgi:hypothetical protein